MDGIPPPRDSDAEDVVWALQTAEALWKRNERGDAIVWVRRAAQAAGMTSDDDRALALARGAAELTDLFAKSSAAAHAPTRGDGPDSSEADGEVGTEIDSLLRSSQVDPVELAPANLAPADLAPVSLASSDLVPVSIASADLVPVSLAPVSIESDALVSEAIPAFPVREPSVTISVRPEVAAPSQPRPSVRVPSAAESHAGMLDPWSDAQPAKPPPPHAPAPPLPKEASVRVARIEAPRAPDSFDDEVVTSARFDHPRSSDRMPAAAPVITVAVEPVAHPPRPAALRSPKPPALPVRTPDPPPVQAAAPEAPPMPVVPEVAEPPPEPVVDPAPIARLDLSVVEAFADLPDDARDGLAGAAHVQEYAKGDLLGAMSLAFVVRGELHVMASGVGSHASTLGEGAVLRTRGTLDAAIALDLVCSSDTCVVATWDEAAVESALGECPWVEDDLRASGDRIQAIAGATLGSLGQRLSPDLRAAIIARLTMRTLAPQEVLVTEGIPVPGILLVGAGRVELFKDSRVTMEVTPGQFVMPTEALSPAPSPFSARAGADGALILAADRHLSQELFATEPLLLELFAGW